MGFVRDQRRVRKLVSCPCWVGEVHVSVATAWVGGSHIHAAEVGGGAAVRLVAGTGASACVRKLTRRAGRGLLGGYGARAGCPQSTPMPVVRLRLPPMPLAPASHPGNPLTATPACLACVPARLPTRLPALPACLLLPAWPACPPARRAPLPRR